MSEGVCFGKRPIWVVIFLLTICITPVKAQQAAIFNNTNDSLSPVCCGYAVGLYPGTPNIFVDTFPFTVQGDSFSLSTVGLLESESNTGTPSGFTLFLYADSGGGPGTVLESWQGIPAGKTITLKTAPSVLHPVLKEGMQYWFGVTTTNPQETGVWWINPGLVQETGCDFFNGALVPCISLAAGAFEILGSPAGGFGGFAYVANRNSNSISAYVIDATGGALAPVPGSPFPTGLVCCPNTVTVDPSGRFLYGTTFGAGGVWAFTIHSGTGVLTPVPGSPFGAGMDSWSVAVDPAGRFAYVANLDSNNVSQFSINHKTGGLTSVGSPFEAGSWSFHAAVDPTGSFVYVANCGSGQGCGGVGSGSVSAYTINHNSGALTPVTGSPFSAGLSSFYVSVDPVAPFAYVANTGSNDISAFAINTNHSSPTYGGLTSIGTFAAEGVQPASVTIDPTGHFVYVTNACCPDGSVSAFTIELTTGALSPITGSPFSAGFVPIWSATDPSGKFLYVANSGSNDVSEFMIDRTTGGLAPIGTIAVGQGPVAIATTTGP